ncbi:MAG: hypothetical protein JWO56_1321 [Acidobacteria bacterium]|nr:hypothetical protein [Acidobacteriota bacterium]
MTAARADRMAILLLAGCAAVVFADVLLLGSGFYFRDVTTGFIPVAAMVRDALVHGEFPVWARHFAGGQPLAANPAFQLFYPGTWLVLLPRFPFGFQLEIVAHVALAACGMYVLLRRLGVRVAAGLFGAIAFGFGGGILSLTNVVSTLTAVAWWPPIILFVGEYVRSGRRRDGALAALTLGAMLLCSEQAVILETAILCATVVLALRAHLTRRRIAGLALIVLAAFAIASVQLGPAVDLKRDSDRAQGLVYDDAMSWSMPLLRPFELFFPNLLGTVTSDGTHFRAPRLYDPPRIPWLVSMYDGFLIAILFAAGLALRMRGWLAASSLVLLSYLLAIGGHGPLVPLLYRAGVLRSVRYPEKFALLGLFVIVIFAATVFDRLLEVRVARAALIACACVGAIAIAGAIASRPRPLPTGDWQMAIAAAVAGDEARRAWLLAIGRSAAFGALLVLLLRTRDRRALTLAVLLTAVDLGVRINEVAPRLPHRYFEPPPVATACARAARDVRLFNETGWFGGRVAPLHIPPSGEPFWIARNAMMPLSNATWGLQSVLEPDITMLNLAATADFHRACWEADAAGLTIWPQPFLRMANAGYRLRVDRSAPLGRTEGEQEESQPVRVEEVETNPRYWLADQMIAIRSREDFVSAILSRSWSDHAAFVTGEPFAPARGRVLSVDESHRAATIQVETTGRAFLVISVTPHRYWRAQIDGRDAPLQIVNLGFQGIVVPAGVHTVTMRYSNPLVTAFGLVSILALAGTVGALLAGTAGSVGWPSLRRRWRTRRS